LETFGVDNMLLMKPCNVGEQKPAVFCRRGEGKGREGKRREGKGREGKGRDCGAVCS
jgi:hypothetical protein